MKLKLNVLERIVIMNLLPKSGNFVSIRAIKNTGKILSISKEEMEETQMHITPQGSTWNKKGKDEKEFDLPASSVKIIKDRLQEMDKKNDLPLEAVTVWEKFFPQSVVESEIKEAYEENAALKSINLP